MDTIHQQIQKRINDLDPGRLRAYNELLIRQKELQDRLLQSETRLNNVNSQIRAYENDDKSNHFKKEYLTLERNCQSLKRDLQALQEELDIANMDPKEAHTQFVQRVQRLKDNTKQFEDTANMHRDQIQQAKRLLEEMSSSSYQSANNDGDETDQEKYELLVKRDQDMSNFIDSFEDTKQSILKDQREVNIQSNTFPTIKDYIYIYIYSTLSQTDQLYLIFIFILGAIYDCRVIRTYW